MLCAEVRVVWEIALGVFLGLTLFKMATAPATLLWEEAKTLLSIACGLAFLLAIPVAFAAVYLKQPVLLWVAGVLALPVFAIGAYVSAREELPRLKRRVDQRVFRLLGRAIAPIVTFGIAVLSLLAVFESSVTTKERALLVVAAAGFGALTYWFTREIVRDQGAEHSQQAHTNRL